MSWIETLRNESNTRLRSRNAPRDANELVILTDALTSVSRFETLHPAAFDVRSLLPAWVQSSGAIEASHPGIGLVLGPEPAAPNLLLGDRTELRRAIESCGSSSRRNRLLRRHPYRPRRRQPGKRFSIPIYAVNGGAAGAGVPTHWLPSTTGR